MTTITVRGTAQREVQPERALVRLGVEASGENRGEVWASVQRAHEALVAQAKELVETGRAVDWTALEIQVGTYMDWVPLAGSPGQNQQVRRFRASGDITVEFTNFTELGRWLASIAELAGVEVRGVTWRLTDQTASEIGREVRTEAVADAAQRAKDYAAAIGVGHHLSLESLFEPGLYPGPEVGGLPVPRGVLLAAAESSAVELRPAIVPVTAEITAVFTTRS